MNPDRRTTNLLTAIAVMLGAQILLTAVLAAVAVSVASSSQKTADAAHGVACTWDRLLC